MVYDPKYKGYWSPALDALARLQASLELKDMCANIMTSYGEALASPSSMDKIWRAYNDDNCEEAVSVARKLIEGVGPCATRLQKQMKDQSLPEPKTGPVASKEEKEQILRQGVVNDVGAAWYVIGRCTARNEEKRDQAIKAFEESLQYPYARVYDPSNGGFFWSPAEDARARLEFL